MPAVAAVPVMPALPNVPHVNIPASKQPIIDSYPSIRKWINHILAEYTDKNGIITKDKYGHRAGDELLCCAARCIREAFYRAEDCFRIGGDEFAVIATAADEDAVKAAVEKLRNLCAEWDAKEEYPVSIAVGYAMQAGRTMTADELFMEADAAMYRNKAEIKKAVGGIIR